MKHYHFIGIGGIGMGGLARLLIAKGVKVSGSDLRSNQITMQLALQGATIFNAHNEDNISNADFIVYSSAIKQDNCEFVYAVKNNVKILKRAELLADLMRDQDSVTVAGAHGKTTTTSMISNMMLKSGLSPSIAIGGIFNETLSNAELGSGNYFVAEVDESDGSFKYFNPKISVVTNIDYEHMDHYKTWDNLVRSYKDYILKTDTDGVLIVCGDDEHLMELVKECPFTVLKYGLGPQNDLRAENINRGSFLSQFDCLFHNEKIGNVTLSAAGKHNILNSLACIGVGLNVGIDFDMISKSLSDFSGVKRRFQLIDQINEIMLVDDYAHHPTEIRATLETARNFNKRIVAVFQPHRYSRLASLFAEFVDCLTNIDYLVITDIYSANELPIDGISSKSLVEDIQKKTSGTIEYVERNRLVERLSTVVQSDDLVLTLGAGDITQVGYELAGKLKCRDVS